MQILIHRIYNNDMPKGYRVLVDRLWPRGVSKQQALLDAHWKELTPSNELRQWFNHEPSKWEIFKQKYFEELNHQQQLAMMYLQEVTQENLILLYAAKDTKHTHALVLQEFLNKILKKIQ